MPTYSYACNHCGHTFDIYQSFTDDALSICPECHGALRKKFSAVGVVFKGSGFYRNDSRATTSTTESASSSEGSTSKESTSSSTSSEAGGSSTSGEPKKSSESASSPSGASSSPAKAATPA